MITLRTSTSDKMTFRDAPRQEGLQVPAAKNSGSRCAVLSGRKFQGGLGSAAGPVDGARRKALANQAITPTAKLRAP